MPEISQYEEESSALIRMYLAGEFGSRPSDVNGYAASAFMPLIATPPIRRCGASGMSGAGWCWPIATPPPTPSIRRPRYRRRSGRISSAGCDDFEYRKLGLPRPDLVVYLDVPTEASVHMLRSGRRRPTPMQTSTSRTPPICAPAGRAAGRPPRYWAGIRCSVFGMISCAPSRISMRRSGARWSRCWTERESNYGLRSVGGWI